MAKIQKVYPDCKLCIHRSQLELPLNHVDHREIYRDQLILEKAIADAMEQSIAEKTPPKVHMNCPCCTCERQTEKACSRCGQVLPLTAEFFTSRLQKNGPNSSRVYYNSMCKPCAKDYQEEYRKNKQIEKKKRDREEFDRSLEKQRRMDDLERYNP